MKSLGNVAVYQCKNLGDALLTTPLITVLCEREDVQSVTVICKSASFEIFEKLHDKLRVIDQPRTIFSIISTAMLLRKIDLMLLPHRSRKGFLISLLARSSCLSVGPIEKIFFWNANSLPQPMTPWRHTVERNLDLLRYVGVKVQPRDISVSLSSLLAFERDESLGLPEKYIVVHPGTKWMFKTPVAGFWSELIIGLKNCGFAPVLTGSGFGSEGALLDFLSNKCGVVSLAGKTSIPQLTRVIVEAYGYIGVDTFATHIAAAGAVSGIAIYGPTSELIWGPYGRANKIQVVKSDSYPCMPCHTDGCGGSKVSECLDSLDPSHVVDSFEKSLV